MIGYRETPQGVKIDFKTTLFFYEMTVCPAEKRDELQALVQKEDHIALFKFLITTFGSKIFYQVPNDFPENLEFGK